MTAVRVDLGRRSYSIHVARGSLGDAGRILSDVVPPRVVIVSNPTVASLYLETLRSSIASGGRDVDCILVPDGEQYKTGTTLNQIHTRLLELGVDRDSALVALGGGVVGDLTGFAAATYQRGIDFIQVPTTLLAQVDSSVGGKTGINHPLGKNMIGAFHQPRAVLIDTDCLGTLPRREIAAGLAEVIKYGLIRDSKFFDWIELSLRSILDLDPAATARVITRSCEIKAEIVGMDEQESDCRALLNFGHTFGHAVEAELGFGTWLHGEAVAAGMMLATELSVRLGMLGQDECDRVRNVLEIARLPVRAPRFSPSAYLAQFRRDKKTRRGVVQFVLLKEIGHAVFGRPVDEGALLSLLQDPLLTA